MRRFLLVVLVLGLAVPAAARATAILPGYAGGAVPAIFPEASNPGTLLVSVSEGVSTPQGVRGREVYFHAQTLCVGGVTRGVALTRPVRIGERFITASGRVRDRTAFGRRQIVTYRLRATVGDDGEIVGTLSVRAAIREAGRSTLLRCSTGGPVRFEMRRFFTGPSGLFGRPVSGASYYGAVGSQYADIDPLALRVSEDGSNLVASLFAIELRCRTGTLRHVNLTPSVGISADGRFARLETYSDRFTNGTERFTVRFTGRFRGDYAVGAVSVSSQFTTKGGRNGDTCRSGTKRFEAQR